MTIVYYMLTLMVLSAAAFLLYKGLNSLFKHRKKELNLQESEARHVNTK
ncbi:hypothetical protein [Filobacillus milosensis]|nr:hypothetical protein [Filobacillus milosensis]